VEVTTATTGDDLDGDGYFVSVAGGAPETIGIDATRTFRDVAVGARGVGLTGVAENCTVAGGNPRDVTVTAGATAATQFDVACQGRISDEIVFQRSSGGLWKMDEDGANQSNIRTQGYSAAVSGNGARIAFFAYVDGDPEILVMNADGSEATQLTTAPGWDTDPAWSPDGSKILFSSERDGNREIYVMNADGSGQANLTSDPAEDRYPTWSPDGTQIAFARNNEIYVMDADGSDPMKLTEGSGPAWSPDGAKIAFHFGDDIHVMDADGSDAVNLTDSPGIDYQPCWSPEGTQIAFNTDADGDFEVYVMGADGSSPTNLTDDPVGDTVGTPQCWR
jgi:Tol biopolymer transport system component